jgi:hypothetical protein
MKRLFFILIALVGFSTSVLWGQPSGFRFYDTSGYPYVHATGVTIDGSSLTNLTVNVSTNVSSVLTDRTNTAWVTSSHALMVEQGVLDYLLDSVALGGTNNQIHVAGFAQGATNFPFHVSLADTNRAIHIAGFAQGATNWPFYVRLADTNMPIHIASMPAVSFSGSVNTATNGLSTALVGTTGNYAEVGPAKALFVQLTNSPITISNATATEIAIGPKTAAILTPATTQQLTNAITALGFSAYKTSPTTRTDGQIGPLLGDASGNLLISSNTPLHVANIVSGNVTTSSSTTNSAYTAANPLWSGIATVVTNVSPAKTVTVKPNIGTSSIVDGDVFSTPFEIDCARANGTEVYLTGMTILDEDDSNNQKSFDLFLFNSYPTVASVSSAWATSDAVMETCAAGPIIIPGAQFTAHGSNSTLTTNGMFFQMTAESSSTKLYGVLKARGTLTVGATNVLQFKFRFMQ